MKSRHLSILPDDSAGDSTADINPASAVNAVGGVASYRARYQAFLNQQSQRSQRRAGPNGLVRAVWGMINFAIFVVLFLAILTLFGFGLSRLSGNAQATKGDVLANGKQASGMVAETSPSPAAIKKKARNK